MTTFEKFKDLIERADVLQIDSQFLITSWVWVPDNVTVPLAFGYSGEEGVYIEESFLREAIDTADYTPAGLFFVRNTDNLETQITFHKLETLK